MTAIMVLGSHSEGYLSAGFSDSKNAKKKCLMAQIQGWHY